MKILVTGNQGKIGRVITPALSLEHEITKFDLPERDALDYRALRAAAEGQDRLIHLAWETGTDNARSGQINPDNYQMAHNAYTAAIQAGIGRIIVASSVHADRPRGLVDVVDPYRLPVPSSPYGAGKCYVEALGRLSALSMEVVCIRFGGTGPDAQPPSRPYPRNKSWISPSDCISLVSAYIVAAEIPDNYEIVHGVSNGEHRAYDFSNSVGWSPHSS